MFELFVLKKEQDIDKKYDINLMNEYENLYQSFYDIEHDYFTDSSLVERSINRRFQNILKKFYNKTIFVDQKIIKYIDIKLFKEFYCNFIFVIYEPNDVSKEFISYMNTINVLSPNKRIRRYFRRYFRYNSVFLNNNQNFQKN